MDVEEAAVRVQAAARGFMARRMVRAVRAVEAEAEKVGRIMEAEAEALAGDAKARVAVGELLMRLLLRLDAVHGAREYRRRVTRRVLALQDAVDALEHRPAPVEEVPEVGDATAAVDAQAPAELAEDTPVAVDMAEAHDAQEAAELADNATEAVDNTEEATHDAEDNEMAPEPQHAAEHRVEAASEPETVVAEMEVDGLSAEAKPDEAADEQVVDGEDMAEQEEEAEGEWEAAAAKPEGISEAAQALSLEPPAAEQQQNQEEEEEKQAVSEGLDASKVMQMVAALCERSMQQCEVIATLAERVDALERAVRRVEESDRRRRRNKKLKKEAKANGKSIRSCYSD
uniref:BAG domain-containing protein n=1 Tax=Oryza brachyantha TaxID=4533 RepID=J3N8K1_ORYBR